MIEQKAKKIKLFISDVDGVLTEGRIVYDNYGDELKFFNVQDGFGMVLLRKAGIKTAIITAKKTKAVERRARDMRINALYSEHKKLKAYGKLLKKFRLKDDEVCFIGDDILDLPIIKKVGLAVAPPNAVDDIRNRVHYVTGKEGGKGAVREVIEIILKSQGIWDKTVNSYLG